MGQSVSSASPDEIIREAEERKQRLSSDAVAAFEWFASRTGEMFDRWEAIDQIADDRFDGDVKRASAAVSAVVGDDVDPVQQVSTGSDKYVGIIGYQEFSDAGAYGYVDYDDVRGERKRVVCARCVEKHDSDSNIAKATEGVESTPDGVSWERLLNLITSHYASDHTTAPSEIEVGASLVSGTTIASNEAWHAGNDGENSGLDADLVRGMNLSVEFDGHDNEYHSGDGFVEWDEVGENEGVAGLDGSGVLEEDQVPDLAVTNVYTVADEEERLSLEDDPDIVVGQGDVAIQDDTGGAFMFTGGSPSDDDDWTEYGVDVDVMDDKISEHTSGDVHDEPQPPEEHGDDEHEIDYLHESDYTPEDDVHQRYEDSDAVDAIESESELTIDASGGLTIPTGDWPE